MKVRFFKTAKEFRQWLAKNHASEKELLVGYYKKASGLPTMTWSESVDQALCYGWIDGIRRSIDEKSYSIRFTPRRVNSYWSLVNLKKMEQLMEQGLIEAAGLAIFNKRDKEKSKIYAYEREKMKLSPAYIKQIQKEPMAWRFFENLSPYYKKASIQWVMIAKRETTRQRRLESLIESSKEGLKIPPLRRK